MRTPLLAALVPLAFAAPAAACVAPPKVQTRIGVMANGIQNPAERTATEQSLGVAFSRPNAALIDATAAQAQNASSQAAGLKTVVTIVNRGGGNDPAAPPTDLAAYAAGVRKQIELNHPDLVVIENEEIAPKFYSGTPQQYLAELGAAVTAAHAEGKKVTNGGLVSQATALMTWDDLWSRGLRAEADDYAQRVFTGPGGSPRILANLPTSADPDKPILTAVPDLRALYDRAKELIAGYKASDMDYVNFHWYHHDPKALAQSIEFLERYTGKPAVTNEIGQDDTDPASVTNVLQTLVDEKVPYAIWYAADGTGGAKGLYDLPSRALRPNGVAFRDYAQAHVFGRPAAGAAPCPKRLAHLVRASLRHHRLHVKLSCRAGGRRCSGTVSAAGRHAAYHIRSGHRKTVTLAVPRRARVVLRVERKGGTTIVRVVRRS